MNSRIGSRLLIGVALVALASTSGWAQSSSKMGPKYDMASEVKVKGVVEDFRDVPGGLPGMQLSVKTDTKTTLVYVGPGDFLKEIEVSFNKGDQVEVVGAKAPNSTDELILAREITVGTNVFTLRDDKGIPVWSGWKPAKASGK
jgi:hypothetical protein